LPFTARAGALRRWPAGRSPETSASMALTETPGCDFGSPAPDFDLPGVDGRRWRLADCRGARGTLVMFICNHCPFVKAVQEKLVCEARELAALGIGSVAIMPNDFDQYPEDSFENMRSVAERFGYPFPYLLDETQEIARAYGAVCTPDFFGFNADLRLQYRGRLDATSPGRPAPAEVRRELYDAMRQVAETGLGPTAQFPSMGCSIKWRG
jgi:peroxiredoxin